MKKTQTDNRTGIKAAALLFVFAVLVGGFVLVSAPKKAEALGCCSCARSVANALLTQWGHPTDGTIVEIVNYVTAEFQTHRIWYANIFWGDNILPALMLMSEQMTAIAMKQAMIIGQFFDATHQMETQQVFQEIQARIHKDYHPSEGMCTFGTGSKSLAASDRKAEFNAVLMSQRSQDRNLGSSYTAAAQGRTSDLQSRIEQFRTDFCNPYDNNDGLFYMCDSDQDGDLSTGTQGATNADRINKDIDYPRTIDYPWTLDVDFTDTTLTDHEEEVLALSTNLYAHDIFRRPPASALEPPPDGTGVTDMQKVYLDARSVLAKRSVAENSFNAITGMKSEGTPGSRDFLVAVLGELGVPNVFPLPPPPPITAATEAEALLTGGSTLLGGVAPSYFAQMEMLTKKMVQDPDFYTNLYDKPANVERKGVALQAIGLMQKFDLFKSHLRNEANLSVLLEVAVSELQEEIENDINQLSARGTPAQQ